MTLIVKPGFNGMTDTDAIAYVNAVETADGQPLEFGVGKAINDFVVGCKLDNTWSAIKASCILAGARTLAGALVPLVGTAPTPFNFVSGDYNRETGLVGNGSTKYLNSNRNNNADPQNSSHASVWVSSIPSLASYYFAGDWAAGDSIGVIYDPGNTRERWGNKSASIDQATSSTHTSTGLKATNRNSSSTFFARTNGATVVPTVFGSGSLVSTAPASHNVYVFARNGTSGVAAAHTDARLAFYSIGESLDPALLDARVSALITAFGVAIP